MRKRESHCATPLTFLTKPRRQRCFVLLQSSQSFKKTQLAHFLQSGYAACVLCVCCGSTSDSISSATADTVASVTAGTCCCGSQCTELTHTLTCSYTVCVCVLLNMFPGMLMCVTYMPLHYLNFMVD